MGRTTPKINPFGPSTWDFVTLLAEDRATATGKMYRKLVKIVRVDSADMLADRQTDTHTHTHTHTHTQTCSSQYFATTPAGELIIITNYDSFRSGFDIWEGGFVRGLEDGSSECVQGQSPGKMSGNRSW